ncbi:NRDE family protein [Reichenbachiella sp. MALMAid0571]|uniref:NRDE family protein n=1 Tax=Reichenbachiella sp. MALMAid0571 TaxID=3143939 RepID=UPI0032DE5E5C
MCLILFSWKTHPKYNLVLAANRDEFYERPTAKAAYWKDHPNILAGKDLQAGGTWIGIGKYGRIAAITNYRDPQNIDSKARSRGQLTVNYLLSKDAPEAYLRKVKNSGIHYNGFNLLVGDSDNMFYYNNVNHQITELKPGNYGLSNGFFQQNWPKLKKGRNALIKAISEDDVSENRLFEILTDTEIADDTSLPKTGIPLEWERALSPLFIKTEKYGTRCSTLIYTEQNGDGVFIEKTYAVGSVQEENLERIEFSVG